MAAYTSINHTLPLLLLLLLFLTIIISLVQAQESRTPHGLAYANPTAFAPSAYEFFHPRRRRGHVASSTGAAPPALPDASTEARADAVHESLWSEPTSSSGGGLGASGAAAIVIGLVSLVSVAVVAAYVAIRRRANIHLKAEDKNNNSMIQPDHA